MQKDYLPALGKKQWQILAYGAKCFSVMCQTENAELVQLMVGAVKRRKLLRFSCREPALSIKIHDATLRKWEEYLPSKHKGRWKTRGRILFITERLIQREKRCQLPSSGWM